MSNETMSPKVASQVQALIKSLRERAEKAEKGWIQAEANLGNCCPLCGWDPSRCRCLKNMKSSRKTKHPKKSSPIVERRVVSDPGAAVTVTELKLSPKARESLNLGSAKLPEPAVASTSICDGCGLHMTAQAGENYTAICGECLTDRLVETNRPKRGAKRTVKRRSKEVELELESEAQAQLHHTLALIHGFNEMATRAITLGEKVYYRLARDMYEDKFNELGGTIDRGVEHSTLLVIPGSIPEIRFDARDIELMRECVARYDRENGKSPSNG